MQQVAPLVGAWIEMDFSLPAGGAGDVAPLVGARIEIHGNGNAGGSAASLPSWERGLK